ncbi:MAG: RagB/SusD family nutrient uptake outer membrane protein [Bacteroidales bacterium]
MKKIYKLVAVLFLSLSLTSCLNEWLTVNPKTDMTRDILFSTESGFKDALTGVYIQLKSTAGYGERLTMTTIEQLVTSWDVTSSSTEQRLGQFLYTDAGVETAMSTIFSQQYKVISSINAILDQIDANKDVFVTDKMYELIKGEALALRALCHFDILRLFGPVPTVTTEDNILPYVKTQSREAVPHISFNAFKAELLKDLNDAEQLLSAADPVKSYSMYDLRRPGPAYSFNPVDTYFGFRHIRMNYYAVKALKARTYLWFGDNENAFANAKEVIDAKNPDGSTKFTLGTSADMTAGYLNLPSEHIFAIYEFSLLTKYNNMFANGTLKKGSAETTIKSQLYGNTGTDIRETYLWELITQANQAKTYVIKKYKVNDAPSNMTVDYRQIPLLRIAEMYLIAVEAAPTLAESQAYWSIFRIARNISVSTLPTDPLMLKDEVMKEYRKEFYAEGQSFFNYKRLNMPKTKILYASTSASVVLNYVVPLPKTELINTNK